MIDEKKSEEKKLQEYVEKEEEKKSKSEKSDSIGPSLTKTEGISLPFQKSEEQISLSNQIGWEQLKITDLPTQGFFYPKDTQVAIRSAGGGEIRHWSSLNEDDLSILDDMLNYILERCCTIKFPGNTFSSWRDIKEVDRFYILLAIRERTFVKGENQLQVKVSETKKVNVNKDMINYIYFDERLMKYYSDEARCFVFKFKNKRILKVYIPCVGITSWLKNYINRKQQLGESFDQDFISFAPFVISDWRGLNDASYEKYVMDSIEWTTPEISMLTEIKKILAETIDPVIKYKDEQGGERVVPLNFQGGIKSIFLISDPFSELE